MKVLLFNQHLEDVIGGSEIQCHLIAKYLTGFGHEVFYAAINSKQVDYATNYHIIPVRKLNWRVMVRILRQVNPDLVYWRYNLKKFLIIGMICRLYSIPLVFSISHLNDLKKWRWEFNFSYEWSAAKNFKSFVNAILLLISHRINMLGYTMVNGVVSLREEFLSQIPNKHVRKVCIYNSIYNTMEPTVDADFRLKRPYIVWVANIKKQKRPEIFIEIARRLLDQPVDFIMIGKIQDKSYTYINDHACLPKNLIYLGPKPPESVNSIIKNSLFLVHTCKPEGFSNNFIQAWNQGKPTITLEFDPDGLIEKFGLGFRSGMLDKMCRHIKLLIKEEALRNAMGRRAREIANKYFVPEENIRKYERFFWRVLNGSTKKRN